MPCSSDFTVAGLFAGVGGIEVGLHASGGSTELLCEWWEPAQAVLRARFSGVPVVGDVRDLDQLPDVDVVAAGFPCTDLSQAGRTAGINGAASGLVHEVFRLLRGRRVPVVILENVRNMLSLDKGEAMRFLVEQFESLGYRWAYRLVDSRFTGVPQRRLRVIVVAALEVDPATILLADDAGGPDLVSDSNCMHGFSWTEGNRGVGWAVDGVPTLKGGSGLGIPSPPGVWDPLGGRGRRIFTPTIEDAEELQGFARGWTEPSFAVSTRPGTRWKLVGNAVTTGVSRWVGSRLTDPGERVGASSALVSAARWPEAAFGSDGHVWASDVSMFPQRAPMVSLRDLLSADAPPLSLRATRGFRKRLENSTLRVDPAFMDELRDHEDAMDTLGIPA